MSEQELVKGLTYLGTVYGKEYTKLECEIHYDFLKEYKYDVFIKAVKAIIKKSKYLPKVNEIIEECEKHKSEARFEILDFMSKYGYFKSPIEYEKASKFLVENNIPEWFKEDMKKYYAMMEKERIEHKEQKLIG